MKTFKINLHSIIDLITNSSTEIYTYSDGSLAACKEMINEFLMVMQIDQTCDDLFDLEIDTEEGESCGDYGQFQSQSYLIIAPKDPKYSRLA